MHPLIGRAATTHDNSGRTVKGVVVDVTCSAKGLSGFLLELDDGRLFDTAAYECKLMPDTRFWFTCTEAPGDHPREGRTSAVPVTEWQPIGGVFDQRADPEAIPACILWRRMYRGPA